MSLSLMHLAKKKYKRVGFIKPIGPKIEKFGDLTVDMDAALMAKAYGLEEDIAFMSPVPLHKGFTKEFLAGKIKQETLEADILNAVHELEKKNDFLIIEGAGHAGVGSIIGLSNAKIAKMLNAPVMIVTGSGLGNVVDSLHLNLSLFEKEKADVKMAIINKIKADKREQTVGLVGKAFENSTTSIIGGFNFSPILADPTLSHIAKLLKLPLVANDEEKRRIIHHIRLGAASSQVVVDSLDESSLVVMTGSRDELLVTLASLYHIPEYKEKIAGLLITGKAPVSLISEQIVRDSGVPFIRMLATTSDVYVTLKEDVAKISAEDTEKLNWIKTHAEQEIDFDFIDSAIE